MDFKILNFQKTVKQLYHEQPGALIQSPDYWQWYTTNIKSIINDNDFILVQRYENQRAEVLAYSFYENENVSDVLVTLNNDNYLWDAPTDWETSQEIIENKLNYYKHENKVPMTEEEEEYWRLKMEEKVTATRDIQSKVAVPIRTELQKTIRKINDYLEARKVS